MLVLEFPMNSGGPVLPGPGTSRLKRLSSLVMLVLACVEMK